MKFIVFYLGLLLSVLVHEFGHYLAMRKVGVRVHSFTVGFGPALFKKRIGETNFSIRAIPLGGVVTHDTEEVERLSIGKNIFILISGVMNNFILFILALLIPAGFDIGRILNMLFFKLIPTAVGMFSSVSNYVGAEKSFQGTYEALTISGLNEALFFIAAINFGLFFFNLIPIPVLDGGQVVLLLLKRSLMQLGVSGKAFDRVSNPICWISFALLIILTVYNELLATGQFVLYSLYLVIAILTAALIAVIKRTDIYKKAFKKS